ncbi:MAG: hypothetical protein M3O28_07360 [Actinomycetota bacterium]|nr:hypothetical protein [Actinomycetota bacterium]
MPWMIATHEVDDVWLSSPKRAEIFGDVATDIVTFVNPQDSRQVGLSMDAHDMAGFQAIMDSPAGADAIRHDGVHPDTLVLLVET